MNESTMINPVSNSPIKIIGIGGGGSSAINFIHKRGIANVSFFACDTDEGMLLDSTVPKKILIGPNITHGQSTGSVPEVGKSSAISSLKDIERILTSETKMVFLLAGLGGGTGTGALPIIAKASKKKGILTVAVVTIPFSFEGKRRINQAIEGVEELKDVVDSYIIIEQDVLRSINGNLTLAAAFDKTNDLIFTIIKGISDILTLPGYINVDFKDLNTILKDSGLAKIAISQSSGLNRAKEVAKGLFTSPLTKNGEIAQSRYLLINIASGSREVSMDEVSIITDHIQQETNINAHLIWGNATDNSLGDELRVTLIATGFDYTSNLQRIKEQIKSIDDIALTSGSDTLSLYFLEEEYTSEEIAEVLSFLSDIYRDEGGDALVIKGTDVLEFDSVFSTILF